MSPLPKEGPPGVLFVTDRRATGDRPLLPIVTAALEGGASLIQVREKDLPGAQLLVLAVQVVAEARRAGPGRAAVFVNDRLDVALASKAAGVHLPEQGLPVEGVRRVGGRKLLVGRSVHGLAEARAAEKAGADYLVFGPVFATPGKEGYGEPQGVPAVRRLVEAVRIPVWAIGGITPENAAELRGAGLAGVGAIRAIAAADDPAGAVRALRAALA
jgi:thiamine-phosphate diphosphorylase